MVECIYSTEVLINDAKAKTLTIVLYGKIRVNDIEICKSPLEFDVYTNDAYYVTVDFDLFIKSWEQQRIDSSKSYVEQLIRFYNNVDIITKEISKK